MATLPESLPPPLPLRQALYIHFWWGSQEFELAASAAAVRTAVCEWPDCEWTGRDVVWLHCKACMLAAIRPEDGFGSVTNYLIPAGYVTEARAWGKFRLARHRPGRDIGIFPPVHPPPIIAVPVDELERLVADLIDPTLN